MGLDDIKLPPIVLQELYKHSLIELKSEQKPEEKASSKQFYTLGNNSRRILVLVENNETLYLPDDQLNFLMGILAACNLSMEDVAIMNIIKNKPVTYKAFTNELKSEKIFLFGVNPGQIELPLDFPNYQIQQFNNQTYLTALPLSQFHDNKAEKTKLWICLKQIFEI